MSNLKRPTLIQVLQGLLYTGGSFALICVGLFFLQLRATTNHIDAQTTKTLVSIQTDVNKVSGDIDDVKVMLNATLFQAGDLLHHTDILVATESQAQSSQLKHVNEVLSQLQTTVSSLDASQKKIAESATKAIDSIPGVTKQLQDTLAETQQTVAKTGKAVDVLAKLESDLDPTIQHINETTGHLNDISASLDTVVKNATKPQPWYKKTLGYVWAPIKIAAIFAK